MWRKMTGKLRDFAGRSEGTAVMEAVMILPVLLMAWVGLYAFWEAYNARTTLQKATFTAADMLSREMVPVTDSYMNGLDSVMEYLVQSRFDVASRFTAYTKTGPNDTDVTVDWSYSPNAAMPALTTATLQARVANLPVLGLGTTALVVDTSMNYSVPTGVPFITYAVPSAFSTNMVLLPRYLPKLCRSGLAC